MRQYVSVVSASTEDDFAQKFADAVDAIEGDPTPFEITSIAHAVGAPTTYEINPIFSAIILYRKTGPRGPAD